MASEAPEIYQRPEDYDLEHACAADDTRFYGHVLRRLHPVRVLELACGSARVMTALSAALPTSEIVGVDGAPEMLGQARQAIAGLSDEARQRLALHEGDMRDWPGDGNPFDVVLLGCCSASHLLTVDDRQRTWANVWERLKPGGYFLMDVAMADLATLAESQRVSPRALLQFDVDSTRRTPRGTARLVRCTATTYEPHLQRAEVRFVYDKFDASDAPIDRYVSDFPSHVYFPSELELLFATTGFEIVQQYGDYGFVPFGRTSPYLITLARRPER
jgi:SAM-dependent methyltransferase